MISQGWSRCKIGKGVATKIIDDAVMSAKSDNLKMLLARMRDGDDDAAWEIVARYGPHIRAVVRRRLSDRLRCVFDSEDFVQAVWASFVRARPKIDKIENPAQLVALLAAMARNKVIDQARRKKLDDKMIDAKSQDMVDERHMWSPRVADKTASASHVAIVREQWERMLLGKPAHHRQILEMRLGGETYVDIAGKMSLNERTVRRIVLKTLSTRLK